jgi:hypothetical protein
MRSAALWLAPAAFLAMAGAAQADSCAKSRDYILDGLAGDLAQPSQRYLDLFKVCQEALGFPNVKDAFVIKAGMIAIEPTRNNVMATAATLSQFCQRFPNGRVRFMTPPEQRQARTVGLVVMMSGVDAASCKTVRGAL